MTEKVKLGVKGFSDDTDGKPKMIGQIDIRNTNTAIGYYNEIIRDKEAEYSIIIDKTGCLYYSVGNDTNVNLDGIDLDGAVITHNHPASNGVVSFGEDDFNFLKYNHSIKELFAVNKEYTYSVKVLKDISKLSYNVYYKRALEQAFSSDEADFQHIVFKILGQEGYVKYERKRVKR